MTLTLTDDPQYERMLAMRQTIAPTLNDGELELFALIAKRKGLDPFSGQIVAVKRNTNRGARVTYQTGIDGYRSIAERTGEYRGSDEPEFGPVCQCDRQPAGHPEWARVVVHRRLGPDDYIHQAARAKWHEYYPQDGFIWNDKPEVMLGKCAEAAAFRKAFPWVLGDIYIPEELARRVEEEDGPPAEPPTVAARSMVAAKAARLRPVEAPEDEAQADPPTDMATAEAVLPVDPEPAPEALTAARFAALLNTHAIPVSTAAAMSEELYPGVPSRDLTPDQWGAIWAALNHADDHG